MRVTLDKARFEAAGMQIVTSPGEATIVLPGAQDMTKAKVQDGEILLLPHRSSMHKLVAQALGLL